MRILGTILVGMFALVAYSEDAKPTWQKVASAKGQFEVNFPGKPIDNSKEGKIDFVLETEKGKAAFLSNATLLPAPIDPSDKEIVKKMFDGGKGGLVKGFKGSKVLSEKNSVFAGKYPCKELDLDIPGLGLYRTKWVLTSKSFIQLVVLGPPDYVEGALSSLFFESLKVPDKGD